MVADREHTAQSAEIIIARYVKTPRDERLMRESAQFGLSWVNSMGFINLTLDKRQLKSQFAAVWFFEVCIARL
jgi:hypothetical protein